MGDELAIGLAETLKKRQDSGTPVVHLNIRANSISKKSASQVVAGIATLKNLTSLDISQNRFGSEAITALADLYTHLGPGGKDKVELSFTSFGQCCCCLSSRTAPFQGSVPSVLALRPQHA